jgi:hypothetical protein
MRTPWFGGNLRQAVARRARRIEMIEVTQGGLGATTGIRVVLVSAFAHDPRR